ncbi:DMT family transporter [Rhizobium sp. ICMP 5592]|uniref:DMT family transporter n=1 Tax=Rhizobium sp. ICMP 5592 TaxID=2292445 RepID=UPI0012977E43|nr:DMT family transporter [Rhizobium sp. ICMP 5592]MQB42303.1 DMT family transporter [Rhizobium sp. ICMP 5592]
MRVTYLIFGLLGLFWGSNFIYMKWAAELITPAQITLLRVFFGFLPLSVVAWRKDVIHRGQLRHLRHFLVMAVLATAFYYFAIAEGTALLPSGIAGILGGSISLFTTIATLLFLRTEKPNALMLAGVFVGFAAIILIARPWEGAAGTIDTNGVLWMLAATTILGLSYVYVRRFLSPYNLPPLALATWQTGLALLVLLALTDRTGMTNILRDWHTAAGVAMGLGVLGTGMAFLIYYYLLQELGAVAASGATYITPNVALLIGWATGEKVGILEIAAIILVLASIAMLQVGRQRAMRGTEQAVRAAARP